MVEYVDGEEVEVVKELEYVNIKEDRRTYWLTTQWPVCKVKKISYATNATMLHMQKYIIFFEVLFFEDDV